MILRYHSVNAMHLKKKIQMRLIDADILIDKSYWHGEMPTYDNPFPHGSDAVDVEDIENLIKNTPAVDTVEVVRCKDCKHWVNARSLLAIKGCTEIIGHCKWANRMVKENGYCVYGEKKKVQG